jgi:predicted SAM-dependent methyltransferase
MTKLHLGCFNKKIHGFTNIDIREDVNPDVVDDIFKLEKFKSNSVDLIYACHVLEHLNRKDSQQALCRWNEVLKPDGEVYIAVPNMEAIFAHYFYHRRLSDLFSALGGSQRHDFDYHLSHFDFDTLKLWLENAKFKNVALYDRWKTDWAFVDDYSAAYYPHLNFTNGKLMSLNVKAVK